MDDDQTLKHAVEWLDSKWPTEKRLCPICSQQSGWAVSGPVSGLSIVDDTPVLEDFSPMVLASCKNCGYTIHFSAVIMGFFEGSGDD